MVLVEGLYTWEKTEQTLDAGTIQFKVCQDHDWTTSYPEQNYQLNIAEAGVYTIKITYNPEGNVVNAVATKTGDVDPEEPGEIVLPVVKIAGSLTSWDEPVLMTNAEDSLSATLTLNLGIDHYQLKVVSDGNWLSKYDESGMYEMKRDWNHVDHLDLINQGENIKLITDVEGAYTFTWTYADSSLVVTFPEYIEPAKEYYAKYADAWTWVKMTEAEGLWLTDTIVYKGIGININDKAADENNMFYSNTVEEEGVRPIAGPAIDVNDTIYFTFNPADSVVTAVMVGKYVAPPTPDPTVAVMGSMNEWADEIPFVLSADKTYASLTVENISAGEYDFKFIINGEWRSNGYRYHREFTGAAGITENNDANMVFVADQDGEYTFYWFFANDSAAIVYPEYIEPAKEYYAKYADAWAWVKMTEAEGLWLTDTIVYKGIGININDKAADENNMFYSNTVEEEGVRPIAGPAIDVNDTIYFTFNPADSVVTAVMVGKYVAPPTPDPTVAVMGSMNEWADEIPFVLSADKTYASLTVENISAGEYDFKFIINGEWRSNGYRYHREFTGAAGITENNDANMVFVADQDGEYTFYWFFANDSAAIVYPEYIEPAKEYYAKYADAWAWVKMTEAEGLWLTDTIVYKGIGININDKAADENNMFYSNTVEEEGVRPIAGPAIDVNDTIYFTFNPADSVVTAVMVGKYVAPPTPDPTVAVMGSMNEWADEIPFVLSADKTYASLTVENISAGEYDFKFIINGEWRSNGYRYHREFTGAAGITENNDANMVFVADQDGEYTFYWFFANDSAAIVYPEYIEPAKEYYAKYADAWAWVKMTEAEGLWLTDTIVYKGIGININDKAADENNMFYSNTVEEEGVRPIAGPAIDVNDTIYFTFNPADSVVTAVMVGKYVAPVEETKDIVIVPGAWAEYKLGAWAWAGEGQGAWYAVDLENEQLVANVPAAADHIIIATFAADAELDWNNKIEQTENQEIDECGIIYINDGNPTWCQAAEPGDEPDVYTVAGSVSILGVDWDVTATANDMTYNEETGIYTLVKENLTLSAFSYPYKVVKNHKWGLGQYPANDDNMILVIAEDGIYNITFTFNPATPELTALAEKVGEAQIEKQYLVVGQSMVANGADWNNDTVINLMTTADEGLTYTLTVTGAELVANATYRYKIVEKGSWNEYFPNTGDDATFSVEADGIYTLTYVYTVATSQCEVQAVKTADLPEARLTDGYYLVGTFSGVDAWTVVDLTEAQRFVLSSTDESGTSYYSLTADLAVDDNIKVVQIIHDEIVLWMPEGEGNNVVVDANHAGEAKNISLEVRANGYWSYNIEPNLYDGYYLVGTMNNWTPVAEYRFSWDETCAEGELALMNVTLEENDALKVAYVENGNINAWYPGEGIADYVIDANHAGETSIYFRYDGQGSADWYYGFFYVIPLSHTDIDNVNAAGEATKILRDGQILIIKGEKMYNVMGQTIK